MKVQKIIKKRPVSIVTEFQGGLRRHIEPYNGEKSVRALKTRLTREMSEGAEAAFAIYVDFNCNVEGGPTGWRLLVDDSAKNPRTDTAIPFQLRDYQDGITIYLSLNEDSYLNNVDYYRYSGQPNQQCYIYLNCDDRTTYTVYDRVPCDMFPLFVHLNRVLKFSIPAVKMETVLEIMIELTPDFAVICDGYDTVWDGKNTVGRFTDLAREVIENIKLQSETGTLVSPNDVLSFVEATDWLQDLTASDLQISDGTKDNKLKEIAENLEVEAFNRDNTVLNGILSHLERIREKAREVAK